MNVNSTELKLLQQFTILWVKTYYFMPPECILSLLLCVYRIQKEVERSVMQINISQISTVQDFHRQAVSNLAMRSRL